MISDVDAFRAAWRAAAPVVVDERPNLAVLAALDRLAEGVVARVAHGSTVEAALKPYLAVVGKGQGSTSDPSSLGATAFQDGDRWLVDVRIGYASSVSAFDRRGRISLPSELRWSYRRFGPFFHTGALIAFDATSLSDMGVRYAFRLAFLRRTAKGYVGAGTAKGFSNYDFDDRNSPRLVARRATVALVSLDEPRSFSVGAADSVLRREDVWNTGGSVARRIETRLLDPDLRACDAWLASHVGARLPKGFDVRRDNGMAEGIRRGKGWVELDLRKTLRFEIALVGKRNVVRRVAVK